MNEAKVITIDINKIAPHPKNPKKHYDEGIEKSIQDKGYIELVVIDENDQLLAGEGRWRALKKLGYKKIQVVKKTGLTEKQKLEYLIASNKLTERGGWDKDILSTFDIDVLQAGGLESFEIDKLFSKKLGEDEFDTDAELSEISKPKAKIGEIYHIGGHVLMCGDSTNPEHVEKLMGGELADMIFTDPPYNIDYSGRGKNTSNKILNDKMGNEKFQEFLTSAFSNMHKYSKKNAPLYTCYASRTHREFENALNQADWKVRNQIIWVKTVASMGWGDYRWKHEPILYCAKQDESIGFYGDRSQYTEWKEELSDEELLKRVKKLIEADEKGGSTVWRLGRDSGYDHPTQKPLQLCRTAIENSTIKEKGEREGYGTD